MSSEQVDNFVAVTNSDVETAKKFLEFSGGDLEGAIMFFFENGGASGGNESSSRAPPPDSDAELASRLQNEAYGQTEEIRAPDAAVRERLVDDVPEFDYRSFMSRARQQSPVRSFSERGIFNQFEHDLIDEDANDTDENEEEIYDRQFSRNSTLSAHQKRLAKLFRPPFDLIEKLTLDGAKKKGQSEKRWILINIQDPSNFQCQLLNRDFWSDPSVKEVVKLNFIFLQYRNEDFQAVEYIQFNPFDEYPHIAILDPYSGERYKMWNEVPNKEKWLTQVYDFLDRYSLHPGHKNPATIHNNKVDPSTLSEAQQLEFAMKKSLSQDHNVNQTTNNYFNPISLDSDEEESAPEFEDDEPIVQQSGGKQNIQSPQQVELDVEEEDLTEDELFATIIAKDHPEPENGPETTRIQIRFGDGFRQVRRFSLHDKVKIIYELIKANFEQVQGKVFTLTSQRINLIEKLNDTIQDAGLKNSSILVDVHDI